MAEVTNIIGSIVDEVDNYVLAVEKDYGPGIYRLYEKLENGLHSLVTEFKSQPTEEELSRVVAGQTPSGAVPPPASAPEALGAGAAAPGPVPPTQSLPGAPEGYDPADPKTHPDWDETEQRIISRRDRETVEDEPYIPANFSRVEVSTHPEKKEETIAEFVERKSKEGWNVVPSDTQYLGEKDITEDGRTVERPGDNQQPSQAPEMKDEGVVQMVKDRHWDDNGTQQINKDRAVIPDA